MGQHSTYTRLVGRTLATVVVVGLILLPKLLSSPYNIHIATTVLLAAYLTSAWNILGGMAGQHSFGHAAFFGIGAYVSTLAFIYLDLTPWLGMLLGGLAAGVASIVIGYPCFKLVGPYYTLATIAFAEMVRILVSTTEQLFGMEIQGASGLLVPLRGNAPGVMQFMNKAYYYYTILAMFAVCLLVVWTVRRSRFGYYLAAIRDSEDAARALGIDVARYKLMAGFISAFLVAAGGTFYAQLVRYISPARVFGMDMSCDMVVMSTVGGAGTIGGPIIGACLITPLAELVRVRFGGGRLMGIHLVLYGLLLMVVVLRMPGGILSVLNRAVAAAKARRAGLHEARGAAR